MAGRAGRIFRARLVCRGDWPTQLLGLQKKGYRPVTSAISSGMSAPAAKFRRTDPLAVLAVVGPLVGQDPRLGRTSGIWCSSSSGQEPSNHG